MPKRNSESRSVLLAILLAFTAAEAPAQTSEPPFPAPGKLIDVGGWKLHLNCTGEATTDKPTVILEAGKGDFSVEWSLVQPQIARYTRVCSYDRAGDGWSELGPHPRTFRQIVYELHTLLQDAGERGPYVFVGHSYGAWLVRVYQVTYPSDVVGLVLVESGSSDPWRMMPDGRLVRASEFATGRPVPAVKTSGPLRESDIPPAALTQMKAGLPEASRTANPAPRDKLPESARRMRTWALGQLGHVAAAVNPFEYEELAELRARAAGEFPLGDLPLVVITRGRIDEEGADAARLEQEHQRDQAALATLSRNGRQVIATASGHHVQLEEPDLVAGAVLQMLDTAPAVDEFIRAQMRSQRIPGLSLAVIRNGVVVKVAGYGFADRVAKVPATPETAYQIASVSKQFIAAGIMLLVESGGLQLDDPITRFLDGAPKAWDGITIRHALTHTSGLVREAPGFRINTVQSDAEVVRSAYDVPLRFTTGEKWEYSNLGYFILAEIIRKVSGVPWGEYLAMKVFRPLGMNSTRTTAERDSVRNLARGYTDNDKLDEVEPWAALRPSGAFISTVLDLARWEAALHDRRTLADSTLRMMWSPVTLNDGTTYPYGLGWQLNSLRGRRTVHHGGGMQGWRAYYARFIDDGLTIIVLANLDDMDIGTIIMGIAKEYLPDTGRAGSRMAVRYDSPLRNTILLSDQRPLPHRNPLR